MSGSPTSLKYWDWNRYSDMAEPVTMDGKGRLVIPREARAKAGIRPGSKLIVEATGPGTIEIRDYVALSKRVQNVASRKLAGWKEEEHMEEKALYKLARESNNAANS